MKRNHQRLQSSAAAGFTLMEVLIAMAILSVGILGVATLQITSSKSNLSGGTITNNTVTAQARTEFLMSLPYHNTANLSAGTHTPGQHEDGIDNNGDGRVDESGETGATVLTYTVDEDTPVVNTKTVTVTVTRDGFSGQKTSTIVYVIPEVI